MKMIDLEAQLKIPVTRINPAKVREALALAVDYIKIAENNGCTTFDEFSMMRDGFFPLEALQQEVMPTEGESEA